VDDYIGQYRSRGRAFKMEPVLKARGVPACLRNRWQAPVFNIYTRESKGNRRLTARRTRMNLSAEMAAQC
jgi:hypothetical protein